MNLANKITVVRVLMIPIFLVVLLTGLLPTPLNRYIATGIFIIASLTDALDGYIARSRNMITNLGKFMDPLADKLLVVSAMIALVELRNLSAWVVIIIVAREFIVTGFRVIAASNNIVIAASWWGKLKTTSQMLMVIFLLVNFGGVIFVAVDNLLIALATAFTLISGVDYMVKNINVLKD
jgi:CDP-diacylglycerol--glycerol-3-phosphate 3-phosphatidyltransferase